MEVVCLEALSEHPNILQIIESSQTLSHEDNKQVAFLVTELASNGEFYDLICEKNSLPMPVVKYYARQLLSAVTFMHK